MLSGFIYSFTISVTILSEPGTMFIRNTSLYTVLFAIILLISHVYSFDFDADNYAMNGRELNRVARAPGVKWLRFGRSDPSLAEKEKRAPGVRWIRLG
uniref:Uncharacterized protein n=1 Tax=Rhabditophanes sp. KR3021 TaxID=114890 RepID=A0AC35UCF7_9BILA